MKDANFFFAFFVHFVVSIKKEKDYMSNYPFDLVPTKANAPIEDNSWLAKRPFTP